MAVLLFILVLAAALIGWTIFVYGAGYHDGANKYDLRRGRRL